MTEQEVPFARPLPTEAESAPGRPGQHEFAAMYQGEFETPWDGTAVAVRLHARALASAGIPVLLKSFSGIVIDESGYPQPVHQLGLPKSVADEVGSLTRTTSRQCWPRILHLVVRDAEHLQRMVIPRGAISYGSDIENDSGMRKQIYDSTIVYSVWERDRIDPAIVRTLSRVAECWVPSFDNLQMLVRSGVPTSKVFVVPHPYDPDSDLLKLRQRAPAPTRRLYSIGRWEPRKAYAELIEAFLRAFTPSDDAALTIKYTGGKWPGYPTPEEVVAWCTSNPELVARGWTRARFDERVTLREGRFPRAEILRLHFTNNIYVSSSRGEAWCLPAFEAMLAGNALGTTMTGTTEFFKQAEGSALLSGSAPMVPVHPSYGWEADAQWLGFETAKLSELLLRCGVPTSHAGVDLGRFSLESVGAWMKERVLAVAKNHPKVLKAWGAT